MDKDPDPHLIRFLMGQFLLGACLGTLFLASLGLLGLFGQALASTGWPTLLLAGSIGGVPPIAMGFTATALDLHFGQE